MKLQYPIRKVGSYVYSLKTPALGKTDKSSVFSGYQMITEKQVAIKQIKQKKLTKADRQKFLLSEIDTLHTLRTYPNIIEVFDVYETEDDNIFIVMEKCEMDLYTLIEKQGGKGFSEKSANANMNQIIKGYQGIYDNQIIHRDLKPQNIFLNGNELKIGDFGYAIKASRNNKNGTLITTENVGSPYYMSPQALNKSSYSYKSDIWALGIIYYEMIFGCLPWRSQNQIELRQQLQKFQISEHLSEGISIQSRTFLQKTLCLDLDERFSPQQVLNFKFQQMTLKRNKTDKSSNLGEIKYKKMSAKQQYKIDLDIIGLNNIKNQKYLGLKTRQESVGSQEAYSQCAFSPIRSPIKNNRKTSNPQHQQPQFLSLRQI